MSEIAGAIVAIHQFRRKCGETNRSDDIFRGTEPSATWIPCDVKLSAYIHAVLHTTNCILHNAFFFCLFVLHILLTNIHKNFPLQFVVVCHFQFRFIAFAVSVSVSVVFSIFSTSTFFSLFAYISSMARQVGAAHLEFVGSTATFDITSLPNYYWQF